MLSSVVFVVRELCLFKDVIPDNVRDIVAHCLNSFLYVAAILLYLRTNELHNRITALLAGLHKQPGCHLVDQAAECLHLTLTILLLHGEDCLLKLVEQVGRLSWYGPLHLVLMHSVAGCSAPNIFSRVMNVLVVRKLLMLSGLALC